MSVCAEHKWLKLGLSAMGTLVVLILGSIWYQNLFLFPQLEIKVTERMTRVETVQGRIEVTVAELKAIHPMTEKK